MNSSKIGALFESRGAKNIPSLILKRLEEIALSLQLNSEELHIGWEELTFQNSNWSSSMFPPDLEAVEALRKKLIHETAKREKKRKQVHFSANTNFNQSNIDSIADPHVASSPMTTTPPAKKRSDPPNKISPSEIKKGKHVSQPSVTKKMTSNVYNEQIGSLPGIRDVTAGPTSGVVPLDETLHLIDENSPKLYMHSTIEECAEKQRESLEEFGLHLLSKKIITYPKTIEATVTAVVKVAQDASSAAVVPEVDVKSQQEAPTTTTTTTSTSVVTTKEEIVYATSFDPVGSSVPGRNMLYCGRVLCDSENGKLNRDAILLEGDRSVRVRLDFSKYAGKYSVFPGQIIVVEGAIIHDGRMGVNRMMVEKYYDGFVEERTEKVCTGKSVWVASGPYTSQYDLDFSNLDELVLHVSQAQEKPDYLILLGPLVDGTHPDIVSGEININSNGAMVNGITLEDLLYFITSKIVTGILRTNNRIQVIIVPSVDDATHPHASFPQCPLNVDLEGLDDSEKQRLICLSNPCTFTLKDLNGGGGLDEGVTIGISNSDLLFHFMEEGCPSQGFSLQDNLARIASQMVLQRSYYPLIPPHPEAAVDVMQLKHYQIESPLDILLAPSRLQPFAKESVCSSKLLCVNPGKSITVKPRMTVTKIDMHPLNGGDDSVVNKTRVEFYEIGPPLTV